MIESVMSVVATSQAIIKN